MEQLIVLGTGHATVKNCFNTCFALKENNEYLLVDGGGGNQILTQLDQANIPFANIHHLFVSHAHTDHVLGVIWIVRMIATLIKASQYQGYFHIYGHTELINTIQTICQLTLQAPLIALFNNEIIFHALQDGEKVTILNLPFTFFDIQSTKMKQFGFTFKNVNGQKIVFCGDEPYNESCFSYVKNTDWLFHEAFCLYQDKDIYHPYEKHHSTAKDAALLATKLQAKHLVLWHTEEDHLSNRQILYTNEAKLYFNGKIYVPYDLDVISLL